MAEDIYTMSLRMPLADQALMDKAISIYSQRAGVPISYNAFIIRALRFSCDKVLSDDKELKYGKSKK